MSPCGRRTRRFAFAVVFALGVLLAQHGRAAGPVGPVQPVSPTGTSTRAERSASAKLVRTPEPPRLSALRYDYEYPAIGYSGKPVDNRIARLQDRLERGELRLQFQAPRGYLDSLLKALQIDVSTQTLVFSKTSLQVDWINAATPRAIYFNDDTFVAWVQGSGLLEMVTMDSALGPVFYTLDNHGVAAPSFDREVLRCLACHDKFSLAGGGVPLFLVASSPVDVNGMLLGGEVPIPVSDETPIEQRWAGWYVTGESEHQSHLGNILVHSEKEFPHGGHFAAHNETSLEGLLDTTPYPSAKSDVVALLVLEHEVTVYNLITRFNFKSRSLLARDSSADLSKSSLDGLPPKTQEAIRHMGEPVVQALLFTNAAPIAGKVASSSGFDTWFQSLGPRDAQGRSLRDLQLHGRLFKYPLSYLVYSEAFDALPDCARQFIYQRLADILSGRDQTDAFAHLSTQDRLAVAQILTATKPEFAGAARR